MWFIVVGVLLIAMKLAEFGFVASWSWWTVLSPFALALAWWTYADASGYTKRREMDKLDDKKRERRRKSLDALGIDRNTQKRQEAADRARRALADRSEPRSPVAIAKPVRDSGFDAKG